MITHSPESPEARANQRAPLEYAAPDVRPRWLERARAGLTIIGGWPRITFAVGCGLALAGMAVGLGRGDDFWPLTMVGGTLLGLTIRVPLERW